MTIDESRGTDADRVVAEGEEASERRTEAPTTDWTRWLLNMAEIEDRSVSISVGGLAVDAGLPVDATPTTSAVQEPAGATEAHPSREQVIAFLDGRGSIDGCWFGDYEPHMAPYWWRKYLPLLAALPAGAQQQGREGWLPIDAAPRDGRAILVARDMGEPWNWVVGWAKWQDTFGIAGWLSYGFSDPPGVLGLAHPTHWMPLPEPPATPAAGEGAVVEEGT